VAFVRDETLVEADASRAADAEVWVRQAMLDAMARLIHPVPVEVGVNWAWEP
jgi:hypothetical protein